jgi:hypothetical protein
VGTTTFQISVENPTGVNRSVKHITLDGNVLNGNEIPLREDGGEHQVIVVLGAVVTTSDDRRQDIEVNRHEHTTNKY